MSKDAALTEIMNRERYWAAKAMADNRARRPPSESRKRHKKPYAKLPFCATASSLHSPIAEHPHKMVPVIDGSVAPKPVRVPKDVPFNYVFAQGGVGPTRYWEKDISHKRIKPEEDKGVARCETAPATLNSSGSTRASTGSQFSAASPQMPASPTLGPHGPMKILRRGPMVSSPSPSGGVMTVWPNNMRW
eukprot:TRINITY_DN23770_c0_g1_i1.p1 TRINITY_DN23770_c0_g1~~TRINITY_DN23770_c0_g1_i1.p1  ORF type:complete len:218 (+),score=26.06 TRINITY_DN23770_c0_g1_i1:87-656(+)